MPVLTVWLNSYSVEWANGNWPRGRVSNFTAVAVPRIEIGVWRGRPDPRTQSRSNIEAGAGAGSMREIRGWEDWSSARTSGAAPGGKI